MLVVKNPFVSAGDITGRGSIPESIPELGRSLGGRHGSPLQCSSLENPMDRGAWLATVHRVAKSLTRLKRLSKRVLWSLAGLVTQALSSTALTFVVLGNVQVAALLSALQVAWATRALEKWSSWVAASSGMCLKKESRVIMSFPRNPKPLPNAVLHGLGDSQGRRLPVGTPAPGDLGSG